MYRSDPVPDIQRLEQLVDAIRRGYIRLPKFQRPFVWDREDMLNLWDSIYNGYPIGSILLWHSSERLKSEREILGFSVQEAVNETYPTDYLLDGQQRLTTVCGAMFWDGLDLDSIWAIHFDLELERFVYAKQRDLIHLFPVNKLRETSDFVRQCMRFESSPHANKYYSAAEQLLRAIKDYKVAVVRIGDLSLTEVAPIFERINSTGRKLTMVDLMRAATWRDGFDLTAAIGALVDMLSSVGFEDVPEQVVLRSVTAATGLGVNKGDIEGLRDLEVSRLRVAFSDAERAMKAAINFLRKEMGVGHYSYLPYGIQLTYTAEFFRLCPDPALSQKQELSRWLWTTSITRYFGGASTGQNSRDLAGIREFANRHHNGERLISQALDLTEFFFDEFNLRTASSTAFCLLSRRLVMGAQAKPYDTRKSRPDFVDIFAGTEFAGRNIGQAFKADSEKIMPVLLPNLSVTPAERRLQIRELVMIRATEAKCAIEALTGQSCSFNIPDLATDNS